MLDSGHECSACGHIICHTQYIIIIVKLNVYRMYSTYIHRSYNIRKHYMDIYIIIIIIVYKLHSTRGVQK